MLNLCRWARPTRVEGPTPMGLRFLHCSDIHLLSLRGVGPHQFLNKRFVGGANLLLRRAKQHEEALFDRLLEHARTEAVDRLVITGDLSNLALDQEFAHIAAKLEGAGMPVTVIPGNHDAYTRGAQRRRGFERTFGAYMRGAQASPDDLDYYPFVQRFGQIALIGVSTAHASLPLYAVGAVGESQLTRLDTILRELGEAEMTRVVLIHHPVIQGEAKPRHDLTDLGAFGAVIAARGAELILHGHEHRMIEGILPGPGGTVPVHGVSSATNLSVQAGREAAFSIYEVGGSGIDRAVFRWDGADFGRESAS